ISILSLTLRLTPISPLFPYTTLFRSLLIQLLLDKGLLTIEQLASQNELLGADDSQRECLLVDSALVSEEDIAQVYSEYLLVSARSEEHTSELQSPYDLVCRLLLEKKK